MKTVVNTTIFSILLLINTIPAHAELNQYQPAEKSEEELMMDLFLSLLSPNIDKAVSTYYADFLTITPLVYPYQINILNMERIQGYRSFEFSVTIEVTPVVGPHIEVGKDQLTFKISPGKVKLQQYKHIETDELPPNWQHIIKQRGNGINNQIY